MTRRLHRQLLAVGVTLLVSCQPAPTPADRLDIARRAMRQGDLDRALVVLGDSPPGEASPAERNAIALLEAEIHLMRRDLAAASSRLDAALAASPDLARLEVRREYLRGYRHIIRREPDAALRTLTAVVSQANRLSATDVALEAEALLGQALYRMGRAEEADARLATALDRARATLDPYDDAALLVTAGMGRLGRDRFDDALRYFEQVLARESLAGDMVYAAALSNAGICYAHLGEFDKAIDVQTRAVDAHEARQVPIYIEQSHGELGNTYVLMSEPARAVPYLERAHRVAADAGRPADEALWLDNLATARIMLGQWDEAQELNDQSRALKERAEDSTLVYNALRNARISAGRGQFDRAIAEFEATLRQPTSSSYVRWQAHGDLAEALVASGQVTRALTEFDRALQLIDLARADLPRFSHRFTFLSRLIEFHQSYVETLVRIGANERALEIADLSRARVLAERAGERVTSQASAAAFKRRAAASGVTLLSYWLADERSYAWIVTGTSIHRVDLPGAATIEALVSRHRQFIERSVADPLTAAVAPGDALAAAVLEPVRPLIPRGSHVVVVPDGALHAVNFETLTVGSPRHYWIDDVTITIAPSLTVAARADAPPRRATSSLLLVGDAVDADTQRPQLGHAATEMADVARHFQRDQTTILRGAAAEPTAYVRSEPARYSTIHFAAHATANAASPLDSRIELSSGPDGLSRLYAREIAAVPLNAELVTISACRGVGDRAYAGEGSVGLAWAFLGAGARRVVAGLWDVDDQASASLMAEFYGGMAAGLEPSAALRAAKLSLIRRGGNLAKPFYWAPLQLFTTRL